MIYAICNPAAGNGRGRAVGQAVSETLRKLGKAHTLLLTEGPGHAAQLAAQVPDGDMILAIGGDGTALEVGQGIAGSKKTLGVIPAGTGNDFIKTLGLPKKPLEALDYVLSHPARETDAGEINGRLFLNEVGTGFDVMTLDFANGMKRHCRGMLPYLYGVLRAMIAFRPLEISYQLDDGAWETERAFVVGAGNGGTIGGGIRIAPEAMADDGLLDVVIVGDVKRSRLPARLLGLLRGKILEFPETTFRRVKRIAFSAENMRVNVDGEIMSQALAEVRVVPKALLIHW